MVGDFSLVDAIESGLVKIPRVPVADDSATEVSGAARRDKTEKVRNSAGPVGASAADGIDGPTDSLDRAS